MFTLGDVPKSGAQVLFSLGTNVNAPSFQVITLEFGLSGTGSRHCTPGHPVALYGAWIPALERNTVLYRCPGTGTRTPGANTALVTSYFLT